MLFLSRKHFYFCIWRQKSLKPYLDQLTTILNIIINSAFNCQQLFLHLQILKHKIATALQAPLSRHLQCYHRLPLTDPPIIDRSPVGLRGVAPCSGTTQRGRLSFRSCSRSLLLRWVAILSRNVGNLRAARCGTLATSSVQPLSW